MVIGMTSTKKMLLEFFSGEKKIDNNKIKKRNIKILQKPAPRLKTTSPAAWRGVFMLDSWFEQPNYQIINQRQKELNEFEQRQYRMQNYIDDTIINLPKKKGLKEKNPLTPNQQPTEDLWVSYHAVEVETTAELVSCNPLLETIRAKFTPLAILIETISKQKITEQANADQADYGWYNFQKNRQTALVKKTPLMMKSQLKPQLKPNVGLIVFGIFLVGLLTLLPIDFSRLIPWTGNNLEQFWHGITYYRHFVNLSNSSMAKPLKLLEQHWSE